MCAQCAWCRNISTHNAMSYAHMGAGIRDTAGRPTVTRLIPVWPSWISDLPCGLRPPRRPSRMMMEPVAALMGIDLGVTPLVCNSATWPRQHLARNCFGTRCDIRRDVSSKCGRFVTPPNTPPRTQKRGRQGTWASRPAAPTRDPTGPRQPQPTHTNHIPVPPLPTLLHPNSQRKKWSHCEIIFPG